MSIMADRMLLRLSATLLFLGELISLVAGYFHPDQAPAMITTPRSPAMPPVSIGLQSISASSPAWR